MKKYISVLLAAALLLCLSACKNDDAQSANTGSLSAENAAEEDAGETLTEKLIREIDGAYLKESELPEYGTTVGMVELSEKYTEKWKKVADEYYDKIMRYDGSARSDDLHTSVSDMKANWEEYRKKQCENHSKTLQSIYGGGTVTGPAYASYEYEMQKEWALQIVGIYGQLSVE